MSMESVNPATGEKIRSFEEFSDAELQRILKKVGAAQRVWARTDFKTRGALLNRMARVLKKDAATYARLMTEEMGKPLKQSQSEIEKCAWVCEYYRDHGAGFLKPESVKTDASKSFVSFEPLGILLAVMPWNFPFWQVFRALVPALMAGNAVVLKHASNVTGCAMAIESIFQDAQGPKDLFRTLILSSKRIAGLIEHPAISCVTLTGSVPAGRSVAAAAGKALKKTVMELGGSDPYLILEDADLESAAAACVTSRLINSGQSCIAAKRFIVVEKKCAEFEKLFIENMKKQRIGDPLQAETTVGPLARTDLRDEVHKQVEASVKKGAQLKLGGQIPQGPGAFYPPTVLSGVKPGMPAYEDEIFGPVAALIRARDEREAIQIANSTDFGLGAAVFTQNKKRGERIAHNELKAGACFVNAFVKSDPRLPFGGIKASGYGRELSLYGIREFVNVKSVYIK